ncbi:fosmidomycin resistance protein [Haloprofundus marisrubri]|uniref:Fosmidomycin resistance protein n=1 Tax=Haloprofundus marisrubri TaxID=1514971 RepID=A0A0W1R9W7_9EURY|nr:VOC family protein [Haloprofundus marisrubri]KTG10436.1 fosmidomycin resistance protein [Haloprofundus marisrubri]
MLVGLAHLGLEVKYLDRARTFYGDRLGLRPDDGGDDTLVVYPVGPVELRIRRPTGVPRGGLHTHFAFSAPNDEYDEWLAHLDELNPEEVQFGSYRSLYVDDPDDHCVEVGGTEHEASERDDSDEQDDQEHHQDTAPALTGIFEVVLEVTDLDAAEKRYTALGFEVVDRGDERRRVRLRGPAEAHEDARHRPFDLELWEPQLGLADARGGVHVELGLAVDDSDDAAETFSEFSCESLPADGDERRVRDPDGHVLTFVDAGGE